ncbi:hypothetical protein M8J77_002857 [Diaphorina citri]|nr:hypothetical protein M8J77_002857 [Diaphorina citri]
MKSCILLLLTPLILVSSTQKPNEFHYSCDNIGKCSCDHVSFGVNLNCVQDGQTSLQASLSSRSKSLHISCNHFAFTKQLNASIFDDLSELKLMGTVQELSFQFCPLPRESFRSFATLLSMISVNKIKFEYSSNMIGMLSPPYLKNLPHLEELVLSKNTNLTGIHMDLFQETPNLKSLFLRGNAINELYPGVFQYVTKLQVLDLGNNNISRLDSGIFRHLTSLRILNLDHNQLVNLTRAIFNSVPHLESLDISGNRIVTFPPGVFADLWELRTFQANKNIFTTFPSDLFSNMKQLEVVKIIYHKYTLMALPSKLFSDLPELSNVTLRESNIRTVPNDLFKDSPKLLMISFTGHKRITSLPRDLFKDCRKLIKLELSDNNLNDLPDELFASLSNLYELNLSKNNFHTIKKFLFDGLTKLMRLDLSYNSIKHLDTLALDVLLQLTFLDLSHNLLDLGNTSQVSPMKSCSKLEQLLLSDNRIQIIYTDWITTMPNLKQLDLRRNKFTSVTLGAIIPDNLLVDLSDNNIAIVQLDTSHPLTEPRDKVPRVILNTNPIACNCSNYDLILYVNIQLDPSMYNSVQLVTDALTCSSTGDLFNKIVPAQLSCLVTNCPARCYCNFSPYYSIMSVNCSSASLTHMPDYLPVTYEDKKATSIQLILHNNSINHFLENPPESYKLITELDLSQNNISRVEMYSYFNSLEKLDLSDNKLEYLNATFIAHISTSSNLTGLGLYDNPWSCNCNITPLHSYMYNNPGKFINVNRISCKDWTIPLLEMDMDLICSSILSTLISISIALGVLCLIVGILTLVYLRHRLRVTAWLAEHGVNRVLSRQPIRTDRAKPDADKIPMSGDKQENCILLPD